MQNRKPPLPTSPRPKSGDILRSGRNSPDSASYVVVEDTEQSSEDTEQSSPSSNPEQKSSLTPSSPLISKSSADSDSKSSSEKGEELPSSFSDFTNLSTNNTSTEIDVRKKAEKDYVQQIKQNISDKTISDNALNALFADGFWQFSGGMMVSYGLGQDNLGNIVSQIAFPVGVALISGVVRCLDHLDHLEKRLKANEINEQQYQEARKEIIYESAWFASKTAISMGAWELGYFAGQCLLTLFTCTPYTVWVPFVLAITAGLVQGISAVATQIAEEKKQGKEHSLADLTKTFIQSFASGVMWQLCSLIPFGSLLAKTVIKPAAYIVGSLISGAATAICSYLINEKAPTYISTRFFGKKAAEKSPGPEGDVNLAPKL